MSKGVGRGGAYRSVIFFNVLYNVCVGQKVAYGTRDGTCKIRRIKNGPVFPALCQVVSPGQGPLFEFLGPSCQAGGCYGSPSGTHPLSHRI